MSPSVNQSTDRSTKTLNPNTTTHNPQQHSAPFRLRMQAVSKGYASVCSGRVLRIIPAFGVGGFLNDMVKEAWEEKKGL